MFKLKFKTFKNSRLLSKISNSYLNAFSESFIHHLNALVFASVEITPTGRVEKVWVEQNSPGNVWIRLNKGDT